MHVLFVIEWSPFSVENGVLAKICESIKSLLYEHHETISGKPSQDLADCAIGFLTFNDTLQFYDLSVRIYLKISYNLISIFTE